MPRRRVAQLVCSVKLARLADAPHRMQKLMWHLQFTYSYIHTRTCARPHSGCCMPLATKKVQKGMWQQAYHSPINCSRYLHENTRCIPVYMCTLIFCLPRGEYPVGLEIFQRQ